MKLIYTCRSAYDASLIAHSILLCNFAGYGDIAPNKDSAKFVSILIIIFGFSLIPAQVAALLTVLYQRPKYIGALAMPTNSHHICICGIVDYELLYRLLTEIYHPTHAPATIGAHIIVVILSPILPSKPVEALLRESSFRSRVRFFVGSSKSPIDLYRIKAENSLAIYILPDVIACSLRNEEDAVFISAISVSRYLDSKVSESIHQSYAQNLPSSVSANFSRNRCCRGHRNGDIFDDVLGAQQTIGGNHTINFRPRTMLKLASSARNRAVLSNCGIDIIMSLQVYNSMIQFEFTETNLLHSRTMLISLPNFHIFFRNSSIHYLHMEQYSLVSCHSF